MPAKKATAKKQEKNDWKDSVKFFVEDMLVRVGESFVDQARAWLKNLGKKTIGSMAMFVGVIFVLVSLAMFINALLADYYPWIGYMIVGFVVVLIGYAISDSAKK